MAKFVQTIESITDPIYFEGRISREAAVILLKELQPLRDIDPIPPVKELVAMMDEIAYELEH